MRFATLQGRFGDEARAALPVLANVDSVVLLHREGAWTHSTAVMEVGRYLGGFWSVATIGYVIPRPVRDWLYSLVARVRYRVFGRSDTCQIPPAATRHRFLD
jgi:predicted DCC family thiol-disulfide oxidoreductase YuxK